MGTTCGCANLGDTNVPQPATPRKNPPSTRRGSKPKFQDIIPEEQQCLCISEQDLNLIKNQLSDRLNQYQLKNGFISKRQLFENANLTSRSEFKIQFSSKLVTQFSNKPFDQDLQEDFQPPLTNDNINLQIKQADSQGQSYSDKDQTSNKSCLLSQRTHILNNSIFTQRANVAKQFYSKFRYFQQIQLLEWNQNYRKSYAISQNQLSQLINEGINSGYVAVLQSIKNYHKTHQIHLISFSSDPKGIKLHLNGKKRLFPFELEENQQPSLLDFYQTVSSYAQRAEITDLAYCLTGWIPQILNMAEISNFQGIFERLSSNMDQGNTLICFSKRNHKNQIQYASLNQIDLSSGLIRMNIAKSISIPDILKQQSTKSNELVLSFQTFVQVFDTIHLSWNPIIYQTIIRREGIIQKDERKENRFLMIIPPSSQDIQVRLLIQRHHTYNRQSKERTKLLIELFQYEQVQEKDNEVIRAIETEANICSDVFIFQTCKEKTRYLLTIKPQSEYEEQEDLYYSVTVLSFVEMHFDSIKESPLIKQVTCSSNIGLKNIGYGINSPYFSKNIQFSIQTQLQKELKVAVKASPALRYEICLIPDTRGDQNLSKINLESIINNAQVSTLKKGFGSFAIKTTQKKYLLVLNCYTTIEEKIKVRVELRGKQVKSENVLLSIKEVNYSNNVIFVQEIKWLPNHSGPRKRLRSNCNSEFQPIQVFAQFFKNPVVDKFLTKGKYQFFVKSQTFRDYFDAVQTYQDKNMCEPPPLSIAVFEVEKQKKEYRIVSDDAFYIPFGIGFWSQQMEIEEGNYRFVCPKIEKSYAIGIFGIVKC